MSDPNSISITININEAINLNASGCVAISLEKLVGAAGKLLANAKGKQLSTPVEECQITEVKPAISGISQKIVPTANPDKLMEVLHSLIDDKKSNYEKMLPLLAAIDLGYFIGNISCNDYCTEFGVISKSDFSRWMKRKYSIEENDLANMIGEIEAKMKA